MKKKLLFFLFFSFHIFLWAENNNSKYYNLDSIQTSFPTSNVQQKSSPYEVITIENHLQGYAVFLYHYPEESLSRTMYYYTLQEAAKKNLLYFFSDTGYTTLIDADQGIIYGFFAEDTDFVSVRFNNIDSISPVLSTLQQKYSSWKNF